jgi:hypothetical protein
MWHGQTCGLKCETLLQVQTCFSFLMILSHVEHFAKIKRMHVLWELAVAQSRVSKGMNIEFSQRLG